MDGFCFNKGHFNHAGATETEIMPKHFGRKPYGRNNGRYYGHKAYGRTLTTEDAALRFNSSKQTGKVGA